MLQARLGLVFFLVFPGLAQAQFGGLSDPVHLTSVKVPATAVAGKPFQAVVKVAIDPPYHIYGIKKVDIEYNTSFKPVEKQKRVSLAGEISYTPAPKRHQEEFIKYDYWENEVSFRVPLKIAGPAGPLSFDLVLDYMACDANHCLPPATLKKTLKIKLLGGTAPAAKRPLVTKPLEASFAEEQIEPNEVATLQIFLPQGLKVSMQALPAAALQFQGSALGVTGSGRLLGEGAERRVVFPVKLAATGVREGPLDFEGTVRLGTMTLPFGGRAVILTPMLGFLLIAAGAALLALLTPCVFPMIPITVSFFTKQAETSNRSPVSLGAVYAAGIVISFTAIGFIFTAALGGAAAGNFALHPVTQAVIGILFVLFALSLFGLFEMQLPSSVMSLVGRAQGTGGTLGIWLLGLLFAVTTFTCTAPFVGSLLAGAAASGQWLRPVLGMVVFSSVLAVPFFFLSIFPAKLKNLPRAGGWLNKVKVCMGFIELAAAFKFFGGMDMGIIDASSGLSLGFFTRGFIISAWIAISAVMGFYLLGAFRLPHDAGGENKVGVLAMLFALMSLSGAAYLTRGLDGSPLNADLDAYLPPELEERRPEVKEQHLLDRLAKRLVGLKFAGGPSLSMARTGMGHPFENDYKGALALARNLKKPLFIEFTAPG